MRPSPAALVVTQLPNPSHSPIRSHPPLSPEPNFNFGSTFQILIARVTTDFTTRRRRRVNNRTTQKEAKGRKKEEEPKRKSPCKKGRGAKDLAGNNLIPIWTDIETAKILMEGVFHTTSSSCRLLMPLPVKRGCKLFTNATIFSDCRGHRICVQ